MDKKKSNSLSYLQESEDSGSDLKEREVSVVSGQMKLTNMPAKSIGKGLEVKGYHKNQSLVQTETAGAIQAVNQANPQSAGTTLIQEDGMSQVNSMKEISGESQAQTFPLMTSSALASLVKVFPLRENVKVFKTSQGELFSLKSAESYEIKDQNTYSLRMLKDYFLTTQDEPLQLYSFHWMSLGMMRNGLSQTLSITYRKTGKGSLSLVLEEKVDEKYYLSETVMKRLLENHPDVLESTRTPDSIGFACGANDYKGVGNKPQRNILNQLYQPEPENFQLGNRVYDGSGISSTISTVDKGPNSYLIGDKIRRLTPRECERLQGFPDGWTEGVSDTQRYKMMGNAVSVPVIEAIGKKILETLDFDL